MNKGWIKDGQVETKPKGAAHNSSKISKGFSSTADRTENIAKSLLAFCSHLTLITVFNYCDPPPVTNQGLRIMVFEVGFLR